MVRVEHATCDPETMAVMRLCGLELPVLKSGVNCEAYALGFPEAIWDLSTMPMLVASGLRPRAPGDSFSLLSPTGLFGISLPTLDAPWPTPQQTTTLTCPGATGRACFTNHDDDGEPGVSLVPGRIGEQLGPETCTAGQPFTIRGVPLDALSALDPQSGRASRVGLGLRLPGGTHALTSTACDSGTGEGPPSSLEFRVVSCFPACNGTQVAFVEDFLVDYQLLQKDAAPPVQVTDPKTGQPIDQSASAGPRSAFVRLGDDSASFDCAAVRGATFPSL